MERLEGRRMIKRLLRLRTKRAGAGSPNELNVRENGEDRTCAITEAASPVLALVR